MFSVTALLQLIPLNEVSIKDLLLEGGVQVELSTEVTVVRVHQSDGAIVCCLVLCSGAGNVSALSRLTFLSGGTSVLHCQ